MIKQKEIKKITDAIAKKYKPEKIILFGSYAWGKPTKDSDVDLFVVKMSGKKRWQREYELRMKLLGNKFPPMDLLIYTPKELEGRLKIGDFFIRDIFKRGQILYEKR